MDDTIQARAYAEADFEQPHSQFIAHFQRCFPTTPIQGLVLDLGCGPGDITRRFALAYPACTLHAVDGAPQMLKLAAAMLQRCHLTERVTLIQAHLPHDALPACDYSAAISNSLLHHLHDPQVLWNTLMQRVRPGAPVFVMDLLRPESRAAAQALTAQYAADAPEILRTDFFNSLCAAYRVDEVRAQLARARMDSLTTEVVSDRHFAVYGVMPDYRPTCKTPPPR